MKKLITGDIKLFLHKQLVDLQRIWDNKMNDVNIYRVAELFIRYLVALV